MSNSVDGSVFDPVDDWSDAADTDVFAFENMNRELEATQKPAPIISPTKIRVAKLPPRLKDSGLRNLFSYAGEVKSAFIRNPGQSDAFGFVEFENAKGAQDAIDLLDGFKIGCYDAIKVNKWRESPNERSNNYKTASRVTSSSDEGVRVVTNRLFVSYLPPQFDEFDVFNLFKQHGLVRNVLVPSPKTAHNNYKYAFVEMKSELEAKEAMDALHNKRLEGSQISLLVKPYVENHGHRLHRTPKPEKTPEWHRPNKWASIGEQRLLTKYEDS